MTLATELLDRVPAPLLAGLVAQGVGLLLVGLACAFVWLATDAGADDAPAVYPPAVQPGPRVPS